MRVKDGAILALIFTGVLSLHEFLVYYEKLDPFLLPPPSAIWAAFLEFSSPIAEAFSLTVSASFMGLLITFSLSGILAVLSWFSSWARKIIWPLALIFQTIPLVALAPLLVIWFGFGLKSVIVSSCLVCFFPCLAAWVDGFSRVSRLHEELFLSLRSSRINIFLKLVIPSAIPSVFTGLRISAALSVVGAIVGEFIAGGGLGALIDLARTQSRVDLVFAAIGASSAWGLIFVSLIDLLRYFTSRAYYFKS